MRIGLVARHRLYPSAMTFFIIYFATILTLNFLLFLDFFGLVLNEDMRFFLAFSGVIIFIIAIHFRYEKRDRYIDVVERLDAFYMAIPSKKLVHAAIYIVFFVINVVFDLWFKSQYL